MCPLCEKQHSPANIKLCSECYTKLELERRGMTAKTREQLTS